MVDLRFGITFQTERLALIREIARNLVGAPAPQPPGPAGTGTLGGGWVSSGSAGPGAPGGVAPVSEADFVISDQPIVADGQSAAEDQPSSPAARLAGLRLPQPMFLEPQSYRRTLAELAKSDAILAAVVNNGASADGSLAGTDATAPQAPTAGQGGISAEAADGVPSFPDGTASTSLAEAVDAAAASPRDSAVELADGTAARDFSATTATSPDGTAAPTATAMSAAARAAAAEARAATEAVVEQAFASLGLAEGAAMSAAMRSEMSGIVASFILNAHFQPGWPPLRPVQDPEAKAMVVQLAKDPRLTKDDLALLTYLANFGLNRAQLSRILKLLAAATSKSKLLQALAQLFANIGTVLAAVQAEIETLAAELKEARVGETRRDRLTLR